MMDTPVLPSISTTSTSLLRLYLSLFPFPFFLPLLSSPAPPPSLPFRSDFTGDFVSSPLTSRGDPVGFVATLPALTQSAQGSGSGLVSAPGPGLVSDSSCVGVVCSVNMGLMYDTSLPDHCYQQCLQVIRPIPYHDIATIAISH